MSFLIDLKDMRILHSLDVNARLTNSSIAKSVGLTPEVVNYRIKRLEEENILTHYSLIADLSKLGIIQFKLCILTQNLTPSDLEKILLKISALPQTKWVGTIQGPWDVVISCEVSNIFEIDLTKNEVLSIFDYYVAKVSTSVLMEAQIYPRDYLINAKRSIKESRTIMKQTDLVEIDDVDMSILQELAKNVRANVLNIASSLNLTPRIVSYRIKQLENRAIIRGYKVALDYSKLNVHYSKLFIYLNNTKKSLVDSLINYLKNHPSCIIYVKVFGEWDLEPEFEFLNKADFDSLIVELKTKFSNIIKYIDVVEIKKEYKYTYF